MPIYEYQCAHCGQKFEVRQAIGEDGSSLSCPKCHAVTPKDSFPHFLAAAQVEPNPQRRVAQLVVLESVGCPRWGKSKPIFGGGELCLEEMAQALMGKVREPAGD